MDSNVPRLPTIKEALELARTLIDDDIKAAAQRLIAEAAIAEREMLHMYSREHRPDYLTVAHATLEAVNDRTRLLGEVERLKSALGAFCWQTEAMEREWEDGSIRSDHMAFLLNCLIDSAKKGRAALDTAPAVAPGASDAGDVR
jgi:hypothetical protein